MLCRQVLVSEIKRGACKQIAHIALGQRLVCDNYRVQCASI